MGELSQEVTRFLVEAGYDRAHIKNDYRFTYRTSDGYLKNQTIALAAFGASPHSMRTACVTSDRVISDSELDSLFEKIRFLAAPVAIVFGESDVRLWSIRDRERPSKIREASKHDWKAVLGQSLRELSPDAILSAKKGAVQLTFVDVGLTEWAERITEQTLVSLLEGLLSSATDHLPRGSSVDAKIALLRLVFHLFACRVLEDKGVIPASSSPQQRLAIANERFSDNIDPDVLRSPYLNRSVISHVDKQLQSQFAFASLTTEMLGYAYENALVTTKLRRERGIFYTPRIVTNQILSRLPIESIERDRRHLLDPCCGSGSFLLAGFDRLGSLLPSDWSSTKRHQYLRARLTGSDIDEFATEVAALSLVVTDPENRNGWKVSPSDFLAPVPDKRPKPTLIVTNPPFREIKRAGKRRERAADILVRIIDLLLPGGLFGVVLPQSMLESRAGVEARRSVLQYCDLIEIATLPGGLFQSATETAVLLGRKHDSSLRVRPASPVIVRELRAKDLARFKTYSIYTTTFPVDAQSWRKDPQARFVISPFSDLWSRLSESCKPLEQFASVNAGIRLKHTDQTSVGQSKNSDNDVPFVDRLDVLRPFGLLNEIRPQKWLRYGEHLDRPRNPEIFGNEKVLVNSNRNPGSVWRLVAAPAPPGLYFSENFHGIIPLDTRTTIEQLLAVLNSPVANAWFDAHCKKRKVVQSILRQLPFPTFDDVAASRVKALVPKLERSVIARERAAEGNLFYDRLDETQDASLLRTEIDEIVYMAYGLDPREIRNITKYMMSEKRPI